MPTIWLGFRYGGGAAKVPYFLGVPLTTVGQLQCTALLQFARLAAVVVDGEQDGSYRLVPRLTTIVDTLIKQRVRRRWW